jgi:hypothetical protein
MDEGDSVTAAAATATTTTTTVDYNDGTNSISIDIFRSISVGESIYGKYSNTIYYTLPLPPLLS